MSILCIIIIVFYLKVELIKNVNKQKIMIIKKRFEGSVGDYGIARNTNKYLLHINQRLYYVNFI